jgi:hypothetical protein
VANKNADLFKTKQMDSFIRQEYKNALVMCSRKHDFPCFFPSASRREILKTHAIKIMIESLESAMKLLGPRRA